MVGDGQQAIYSTRADIGNFSKHVEAFRAGNGGELLEFQVTFRAPRAVIRLLNATLPPAQRLRQTVRLRKRSSRPSRLWVDDAVMPRPAKKLNG